MSAGGGWRFVVTQGGENVASGSGPTEESVIAEAKHYALMYAQDGAVSARWWQGAVGEPTA